MVRSYFANQSKQKLEVERDNAVADATIQGAKAQAKAAEVEHRIEQQNTEEKIHAQNTPDDKLAGLNSMFK